MRLLRRALDRGSGAHTVRRGAAVMLVAGLLTAACSSDDDTLVEDEPQRTTTSDDGQDSTTTESPASTTATTTEEPEEFDSVEEEIVARYEGYWDARFEANSPPNPDDAALREYATGEQLDHVIEETQANLNAGVEFRRAGDPVGFQEVRVVSVDGDAAVVQECVVNDNVIVRSATGAVVDDAVATYNVRGDMVRVDGEWRLAMARRVQRWEGVAGCALAD